MTRPALSEEEVARFTEHSELLGAALHGLDHWEALSLLAGAVVKELVDGFDGKRRKAERAAFDAVVTYWLERGGDRH